MWKKFIMALNIIAILLFMGFIKHDDIFIDGEDDLFEWNSYEIHEFFYI